MHRDGVGPWDEDSGGARHRDIDPRALVAADRCAGSTAGTIGGADSLEGDVSKSDFESCDLNPVDPNDRTVVVVDTDE